MREVILKLERVEVAKFDPRSLKAELKVSYSKDSTSHSFIIQHNLTTKSEGVVQEIIRELKKRGNIETDSNDLLQSMYVKKFLNEDRTEERMLLFFSKLYERGRLISREKDHTKYMKLLDEIQHHQIMI